MTTWVLPGRPDRRRRLQRAGAIALAAIMVPAAAHAGTGSDVSPRVVAAGSPLAHVAGSDAREEQLIRTLVDLTDTPEVQALFSQELVDRVSRAIAMFGPTLNPRTMGVIQQQTRAVVSEHIRDGDALYSVLAPVYEKHFNLIELSQLVRFYRSPLGQKLVDTSPELMAETLDLGSQWGLSLVPEILQRVRAQLDDPAARPRGGD
ncbi:DUF2059 domain-containing protein [Salinisphaera sp. SWV1]|uniref:DUF2059 domain-containing protein n=1 Tax=Salinisphaera sp. SWV1 TaxID=3454139 RepID=UPI003F825EB4